jgi:hypothetical protein
MKLTWKIAAAGIIFFLILILAVPEIIRVVAVKKIEKGCKYCKLEIGDVDLNPFTGTFSLKDMKFRYEAKGFNEIDWDADKISGEISLLKLISGNLILGEITIGTTNIVYFDGDAPKPKEEKESDEGKEKLFSLNELEIKQASFTYIRKLKNTRATLKIPRISAKIGRLGNTPELKSKSVEATGNGQIEKSGEVWVKVNSPIFERPLKIDVDIAAKNHDLSDLTPFFKENAGVSLKGILIEGTGKVALRDRTVATSVYSKFKNFDAKFNKMYDRSEVAAFFMNLGKEILFEEKNTDKNKGKQIRSVELTREKDEPIVGFILRSLKEAAIKIVSA